MAPQSNETGGLNDSYDEADDPDAVTLLSILLVGKFVLMIILTTDEVSISI